MGGRETLQDPVEPAVEAFVVELGLLDHAGWRWIFAVNLPLIAAVIALSVKGMARDAARGAARLDWVGALLLCPGLAALVYGFTRAGSAGDFAESWALIWVAAGGALITVFIRWAVRRGTAALIDLRLFRERAFAASVAGSVLVFLGMLGAMMVLPLYLQQVRGESALGAGLLLAPQGAGMGVALVVGARLLSRYRPRATMLTGLGLLGVGTWPLTTLSATTSFDLLAGTLALRGIGTGPLITALMTTLYAGLRKDEVARATTASRTLQQLAGSLGVAILAWPSREISPASRRERARAVDPVPMPSRERMVERSGSSWSPGSSRWYLCSSCRTGNRSSRSRHDHEDTRATPSALGRWLRRCARLA